MTVQSSPVMKLAQILAEVLPTGSVVQNTEVVARRVAERLDLVTREEFDVQQKVLQRTRQKVDALEQQLKALENPND